MAGDWAGAGQACRDLEALDQSGALNALAEERRTGTLSAAAATSCWVPLLGPRRTAQLLRAA